MESTELMLREELRQLIQNNASLQEIQDHIVDINMIHVRGSFADAIRKNALSA